MKGFSIIEAIISLLVLSFAILALASLQLISLRTATEAYHKSLAIVQIYNLLERLRVNQAEANRKNESTQWNKINAELLPNGIGHFSCYQNKCEINLKWRGGELTITSDLYAT